MSPAPKFALLALLVGATCIGLVPLQLAGGLIVLVGIHLARRGSSAGQ